MSALNRTIRAKRRAPTLAAIVCLPLLFGACGDKSPEEFLASAKTFLAKNDRKAAVIQIKNAIQADPNLGEARYLLGVALLDGGDPVQSEVELQKAARLKYSPDLVVPKLASGLLLRGENKRLLDEYGAVQLAAAPARAALATSVSMAYARLGNLPKADASVAEALAADPAYAPALLNKAQLLAAQNKYPEASAVVADLLRTSPTNAEAWKLKGDVDFAVSHDIAASLVSYRKAVDAHPEFVPGHLAIITALLQQKNLDDSAKQIAVAQKLSPNDMRIRYMSALVTYLKKDVASAQTQVAEVLKVAPDNVPTLLLAGSIELETNALSQSQTHLSRALQLAPESSAARRLLMASYLRSGQPERAVAVLNGGRSGKDVDPDLYSVAGEAYFQTGNTKAAQQYFEKAAKLDPKDARKQTVLALSHLNNGEAASGFAELQQVAASDGGTTADIALINAYLSRKQNDQALKAIDALERKKPDQPTAPYLRGMAQLKMQDAGSARKSFEKALTLAPNYFPAAAALTSLDIGDRKLPEAKARLAAYLVNNPKDAKALMAIAEVESLAGASSEATIASVGKAIDANPADPAPRLMLVDLHVRAKDFKQAVAVAQAGATALPDNPLMLETLGRVQLQAGDTNQAIKSFTRLAELQPEAANPFLRLALAQLAAKSLEQAEQSLNQAIKNQPDFLPAQRTLAALYVDSGRSSAALKVARTVISQRPKEATGYKLEGDIDSVAKDFPAAVTAYRSGLKEAPSTELAISLHGALLKAANTADADRLASDWQRQHPDDPGFLFYVGDMAMRRKDLSAAETAYTKVTKIQPGNAAAYNNLSWTATQLKKDTAVLLAEKANALSPGQPAFMDTLATALSSQGQYAKAIEVQKKAIGLEPKNASLKFNLAKIYVAAGDKRPAQTELQELQRMGTAFGAQDEVAQLLKSL